MTIQHRLTRTDFEAALTPATLRTMAILHMALAAAPLLYVIPLLILLQGSGLTTPRDDDFFLVNILTLAHLLVLLTALYLGTFLFQRFFSPSRLVDTEESGPGHLALRVLGLLRSAIIARLVLLEGASFFGLAVCIIAILRGVAAVEPLYYVNLGSIFVLAGYGVLTFPTKERLVMVFEESFLSGRAAG